MGENSTIVVLHGINNIEYLLLEGDNYEVPRDKYEVEYYTQNQ